jgi:predicted amidohydrolase
MNNMKISLIHMKVRNSLTDNLKAASLSIHKAKKNSPALIALPEYFSVPGCLTNFNSAKRIADLTSKPTFDFLSKISHEIPQIYLLGGTYLEEANGKYYNTSTLWKNGSLLGKYKKKNPIKGEIKAGVARGSQPVVIDTSFGKIGLLVCADMFDPILIKQVVALGAEVLSLPVAAMGSHPTVNGHPLTEKVASENGVFVLKVGNVCSSTIGGRSAIIAPWGIIIEVTDSLEDTIIYADLDMKRLIDYRKNLNK